MSHLREKRPPQVVVLLGLQALCTLSSLVLLLAIVLQPALLSSGTDALDAVLMGLLLAVAVDALLSLALFLLLLFGTKAGFYLAAASYILSLFSLFSDFSVTSVLMFVLCLLLLLSRPSRRYFRIGAAAQAAPGTEDIPVRSSGSRRPPRDNKDWDPWDLPDKR